MFKYHDKDYDGIVLKLNSGFMATNPELEKAIKVFEQALKDCKFSLMHPDHERNLSELENYKEKQGDIRKEKQEEEEFRLAQIDRRNKLINADVLEIEYRPFEASLNDEDEIELDGVRFDYKSMYTRTGLTAKVKRAFNAHVNNLKNADDFIKWVNSFCFPCLGSPNNLIRYKNAFLTLIGGETWAVIKFEVPYVRIYQRGKRDTSKLYYRKTSLKYEKQHGYYLQGQWGDLKHEDKVDTINGTTTICRLNDYELVGDKFIKKTVE